MKKNEKVLYSTDLYKLIETDGLVGIKPMLMNVIVMPFTCDENKLPLLIGVVQETNPFREGGLNITLPIGLSEDEDPDLFSTAKRALADASSINIEEADKWYYLGTSTTSSFVDTEYPCFAVDVTGVEPTPDDNEPDDKRGKFKFIPANDVVKAKDIFIPGLFLKLFKYVMGMNISNPDGKNLDKDNVHNLSL